MSVTFTILGCGSSGGVPRVGQGWGVCDPNEPRNRRRRCSMLVERFGAAGEPPTRVLIDTSPDLREQLLDAQVDRLDGVLFTHEHADHTHGIDDLRPLTIRHRRRIDVHVDAETSAMLHQRFGYCFETPPGSDYPPILTEHRFHHGDTIRVDGPGGPIEATAFRQYHGNILSYGFRIGGLAYSSDLHDLPEESLPYLEGLDLWIIDALRPAPHPTHFSLSEALDWIARLKPRRAVLTNMHTDLDYGTLARELPEGIVPAYDGLKIEMD
ncbi:MBL fold metallo-hydrolase [Ancylobacter amanitiformis]|uniref:Phosphoribosyl 1,2-cyclic phosphate phosphodiesterase n=1 Tax=Ancylobacter amanitiformis TaxID=217069 RepID=A0ABU0LKM2_9HYPH|nr:MBL fold metallo-hydrolase [Ancylobacter amanitiformis]MDQ0509188.1 phosphoribosyl 1,2-cyclic phosphate phosphodiesterase [Ancylobacter amanitiformis]